MMLDHRLQHIYLCPTSALYAGFLLATLSAGDHNLTATFEGTGDFAASSSTPFIVTAGQVGLPGAICSDGVLGTLCFKNSSPDGIIESPLRGCSGTSE